MSGYSLTTFLSPQVRKMLVEIGNELQITQTYNSKLYISSNGTFNWTEIKLLIGELPEYFDIHEQSSDWFSTIIYKIWPVFTAAERFIKNCSPYELQHLRNLCRWTRKEDEIEKYYSYFISNSQVANVEVVLFLTSILERSLGNVFLLKGHHVPFLLRELLSTKELKSTLGIVPIVFTQVLLGTPSALNLRNVAWHGFPKPEEIKSEFSAALFLIIASVGELLSLQDLDVGSLPSRPQVINLAEHASMLQGCFPLLEEAHETETKAILFNTTHIAKSHQVYWETIMEHYFQARYGECLLLLLPQLEHMLRSIFCWANNCPERVLTAESTVFYTTLDDILSEYVKDNEINSIQTVLGYNILVMLHDVFVYQKGPRIRDKFSHGECNLADIPQILVNHVILIALAIILKVSDKECNVKEAGCNEHNVSANTCSDVVNGSMKFGIRDACQIYETRFHNSALLKTTIMNIVKVHVKWKNCPRPETKEEFDCKTWDEAMQDDKTEIPQLKKDLWKCLASLVNIHSCEINFSDLINSALRCKILTIYRPKIENDILNILQQIEDNVLVICVQVQEGIIIKYQHFCSRHLRSRQRDTYQRMLNTVPCLYSAIQVVTLVLVIHLLHLNTFSSKSLKECQHVLRFLKHILQYVQNITTYTSSDRNRWDEIRTATSTLSQHIIKSTFYKTCAN